MTNSKVRNLDSAYLICFNQVLLKLFTYLINTADKKIYTTFSIVFYSPFTLIHTTHTNINRVLIINLMIGMYLAFYISPIGGIVNTIV